MCGILAIDIYQEVEDGEHDSSGAGSDADVAECVELLVEWNCYDERCVELLVKQNPDVVVRKMKPELFVCF